MIASNQNATMNVMLFLCLLLCAVFAVHAGGSKQAVRPDREPAQPRFGLLLNVTAPWRAKLELTTSWKGRRLLAPSTNASGFISIRLQAGVLASATPVDNQSRVIALLRGTNGFWQRKQMYVNRDMAANAFIDWYFLDARANYTLFAYVDKNKDGICKETAYARTVKPVKGVSNQVKSYEYSYLIKSTTACAAIDSYGPKNNGQFFRVTVAPSVNLKDVSSPWYSTNGALYAHWDNRDSQDFFGYDEWATLVHSFGTATTARLQGDDWDNSVVGSVGTCGDGVSPSGATCKILSSRQIGRAAGKRDFDTSIPPVYF